MGLLSFFKRRVGAVSSASGAGEPPEAVQQARTRARRRLIGAAVLVVIGVIGFPLVFETQPRPIPVDIPIEIPRKEGAAPLVTPGARTAATGVVTPALPAAAPVPRDDVITESRSEAGRELTPAAAPPAPKPVTDAPRKPAVAATAAAAEATRAQALLDAAPQVKAEAAAARFVVQVGAFSEADAARETRAKVEKLGLKTYTQVAQTAAGQRIRVRVGPYASREEADKAMAKARAAGVAAVVLTL
jgi:DedD protein